MKQCRAVSDGRGRRLLAVDKLLEKPFGIVDLAAFFGKVGHVPENAALRLRLQREIYGLRTEEIGHAPVRAVCAAVLVHHHAVLFPQVPVAGRQQLALRPLVQRTMLEEPVVPALRRLDLPALRKVPKLVLLEVNVLRRMLQIEDLATHKRPATPVKLMNRPPPFSGQGSPA